MDAILERIGLSASALNEYDRRIPEASRARAWVEAAEQTRDPAFGLGVAEHAKMGAFDALDYSLYFSRNVGEAFEHVARFHRVLCDAWAFKFDVEACVGRVRRIERTPPPEAEAFFALLVVRARELSGVDLRPRGVTFAHPTPADTTRHDALFRCPVRFGSPDSEISFRTDDLALPIRTANAGVGDVLDRYMTDLLGRLPKSESFVDLVRSVVLRSLRGGRPALETTAKALHASPRTVRALLMPVAGARFIAKKAYSPSAALGLTLGGLPAVLVAAWIVRSLPLEAVRWLVIGVVAYASAAMLRSAAQRD